MKRRLFGWIFPPRRNRDFDPQISIGILEEERGECAAMKSLFKFLCGCVLLLGMIGLVYLGVKGTARTKGYENNRKEGPIGRSANLDSSAVVGQISKGHEQRNTMGSVVQESSPSISSVPNAKQRLEEQLCLAASVFGLDLQAGFSSDEIVEAPLSQDIEREVRTHDAKRLVFDVTTGQLLIFSCMNSEDIPEGLSRKDAISEEQAMQKIGELLQKLGTGEDLEIDKVYFQDSPILAEPGSDGRLEDAAWVMEGHLTYHQIPCLGTGMRIEVSAYSGMIMQYLYRPCGTIPETLEEKVNANQALETAQNFLKKWYRHEFSADQFKEPEKCISYANNCWTRRHGETIKWGKQPLLCWIVRVQPKDEEEWTPVVNINAITGRVCGGVN